MSIEARRLAQRYREHLLTITAESKQNVDRRTDSATYFSNAHFFTLLTNLSLKI